MDDSIHNLRDALEWLDSRIREEAELDGEMSNDHAIQLGFITNMLEKFPPRNCDVGTAEEQVNRHKEWCDRNTCIFTYSCRGCFAKWAQMPYESEAEK
jgi:hypothetical protein